MAMLMKYVLANWKSNKTLAEAENWLRTFAQHYTHAPNLTVIVAPPALYLVPLRQLVQELQVPGLCLAIQDLSAFPLGSYTGEIAADMVRDLVEFAILGHSERRRYCRENNQDIANKVSEAVAVGIRPVVCVDLPYARSQLAALEAEDVKQVCLGYGPVEAAGVDRPQSVTAVREALTTIQGIQADSPVFYGGSINSENAAEYCAIPGVAGLMVGSASLDAEEFSRICAIVAGR